MIVKKTRECQLQFKKIFSYMQEELKTLAFILVKVMDPSQRALWP